MPALIIKPRLILVAHMDYCWHTSNQQRHMVIKWASETDAHLKPQQDCQWANVMPGQITYCTTDCIPVDLMFRDNFPTNPQVLNRLSQQNDCRQRGVIWVTMSARTASWTRSGTSVINRSSVTPHAWVVPTTNWLQPETVESKALTSRWFVVLEPNYSWWKPFK